jgi:hypothetical protein
LKFSRDLEPLGNETVKEWKRISDFDDLVLIQAKHKLFSNVFYNSLEELQEPLFYPESMLEPEFRDRVDPMFLENGIPQNGSYRKSKADVLFHSFSREWYL